MPRVLIFTLLWMLCFRANAVDVEELIRRQNAEQQTTPSQKARLAAKLQGYAIAPQVRSADELIKWTRSSEVAIRSWEFAPARPWHIQSSMFGGGGRGLKEDEEFEMFARSQAIAAAIEARSGSRIPLEPYSLLEFEREAPRRIDGGEHPCQNLYRYFMSRKEDDGTTFRCPIEGELYERSASGFCALLTPSLLSSGFSSLARQRRFEFDRKTAKNLVTEPSPAEQYEVEYLGQVVDILRGACTHIDERSNPNRPFIKEYLKLLGEFGGAIDGFLYSRHREAVEAEKERRAELSRLREEAEKREFERRRSIMQAQAERERDLKSGRVKPENAIDVELLWRPGNGASLVAQPPLIPDRKVYAIRGKLVRMIGSQLVFEVEFGRDVKYFIGKRSGQEILERGYVLRYEGMSTLVGLFVAVEPYKTVGGVTRMAPAFQVLYLAP